MDAISVRDVLSFIYISLHLWTTFVFAKKTVYQGIIKVIGLNLPDEDLLCEQSCLVVTRWRERS